MLTADPGMTAPMPIAGPIRTRRQPECHVCGSAGDLAYAKLTDRLFGAPGEWTLWQCSSAACGLLWLNPMPVEEDLPRLYESYYTHSNRRNRTRAEVLRNAMTRAYLHAAYGPKRSRLLPALLTLAPGFRAQLALQVFGLQAVEGGRLLDVGCGSGALLERMADLGWRCEGIDFDEGAVKAARARGLDVRVGGLEEQAYPAGTFDAVVMNHVLEHVHDPRAVLSESLRILKPGGRFACTTPNARSWCHSIFGPDWRGLEPPRHLHIFTRSSLGLLMQEMPWSSVEVQASIGNTHWLAWASWELKRTGKLDMSSKPGLWAGALARIFQTAASVRLLRDSECGEELLVRATKTPPSEHD